MKNRWILKRTKINTKAMAEELHIRQATACVLAHRGIATRQQAAAFLNTDEKYLYSLLGDKPMKDAEKALQIIDRAIEQKQKIAIYGDYDVDGVTSTSIWYKVLCYLGADVMYRIPHRQSEGYGLNVKAVEQLHEQGVQLLITCDNGISALAEIKRAKELGMNVVVIDHHEPAFDSNGCDILPEADAIVDPKQRQCQYPFKLFCAGGLCYKLISLFLERKNKQNEQLQKECLHLAALATICDIVDLLEENRIIAKEGLKTLKETTNVGLRALLEQTDLLDKEITEYHVGFIIGPCINAAGRLSTATTAVELFCEKDEKRAKQIADELIVKNNNRKEITQQSTEQIIEYIEQNKVQEDNVIVVYQNDVEESVAGIVAGRIKEKYYKPTIVITKSGEDMAKGSGRSIEGYNMFEELYACRELFEKFGGHTMAAGLSITCDKVEILKERLNKNCKLLPEQYIPILKIEKQLHFEEVDLTLAKELKSLAPFGKGNHIPLFGSKNVAVENFKLVGQHKNVLRMVLREGKTYINAICFDEAIEKFEEMIKELYGEQNYDNIMYDGYLEKSVDIVYGITINTYQGNSKVQLDIKDFRFNL